MGKSSKAPLGASLVVLSSFFYATYGIWTKLMGDFFEGYSAAAYRSILVLLILFPIAIAFRQLQPLKIKQNGRYFIGLIIGSLFTWGPLYYAILHAGVGVSVAISYASIVISSFFFGWLFGREKLTRDKIISAALGFVGLGLIFAPSVSQIGWLALLGAFVSGLSIGAENVFTKKIHYNSAQSTIALWVASVIANACMAFVLHENQPAFGLHIEWLYLVYFAIASVIASWLLVKGVKLIDVGAAGVLGLLEIAFGILFGVILFHEQLNSTVLCGIAVIILAAALPYLQNIFPGNITHQKQKH